MFSKSCCDERQLVLCDDDINEGDPTFLGIGNHHPVSLYGCYYHSAAIGSEGEVIFIIRYLVIKSPHSLIEAASLPDGEKASFVVLSSKGRVFTSWIKRESCILYFSIASELSQGRVFGRGSNKWGELGLGERTESVSSFTEISSLVGYEIRAAYAGHGHSLFKTREDKILACGSNYSCQLLLSSDTFGIVHSPRETTITGGAAFCISVVFIGSSPPLNTPNMRIVENEL
ncbi:hypothetical protein M9Y10_027871 [Tritrichomonas musculus]|uniref:Uncharacterized protein n=1 Tax=Tritrichomonas musculus TaxID=1915356 RepID=A0ABR2GNL9_9EUKA